VSSGSALDVGSTPRCPGGDAQAANRRSVTLRRRAPLACQHVGVAGPTSSAVRVVIVSGWPGAGKSTIADAIAAATSATVVSFDWVMSGLRVFPDLWERVELPVERQREVGWALMSRVAEQQLRRGSSVVFDLVARDAVVDQWSRLAERTGAELSVIECFCDDERLHRARVENRERDIPGWYELTWEQAQRSRAHYLPLSFESKLVLSAHEPVQSNIERTLVHLGVGRDLWPAFGDTRRDESDGAS
jgi:predicted kinase